MASGALPADARLLGSLTYGNGLVLQRSFTSDGDLDWLSVSDPAVTPGIFLLSREHVRSNQLDLTGIWDQTANTNSQTFIGASRGTRRADRRGIRDAMTGALYVLEVNAGGNTWHLSSDQLAQIREANGPEFERRRLEQFDAPRTAARVLAETTRAEAK